MQPTFNESIDDEEVETDGYLYRLNEILARRESLSEELLGRGGSNSLWGGRLDIVVERFEEDETGNWELDQEFLREVKYTQIPNYVATGLREFLEYIAFVKRAASAEYVKAPEDVLDSVTVHGLLFVDELDFETDASGEIDIIQYPESPGQVL